MLNMIRTAALSAAVGLGALAAVPAAAQADGIYLNFGANHDSRLGVYAGDRDRGIRHWHRDRDRRRACSPNRALDKAERMGLRRARIVDVGRRTIKVAGRKYNQRVMVVFGRDRSCPVIYR